MSAPCTLTQRQIADVFATQLGGHCLSQTSMASGSRIEQWSVAGHVVIVVAYPGRNGWTHYLPSKTGRLDKIADEIREHLNI